MCIRDRKMRAWVRALSLWIFSDSLRSNFPVLAALKSSISRRTTGSMMSANSSPVPGRILYMCHGSFRYLFVLQDFLDGEHLAHGQLLGLSLIHICITLVVTADHGNADRMVEPSGSPNTAHTTNPVPLVLVGTGELKLRSGGRLADIAPTMLELMGLGKPAEMTGESLIEK